MKEPVSEPETPEVSEAPEAQAENPTETEENTAPAAEEEPDDET